MAHEIFLHQGLNLCLYIGRWILYFLPTREAQEMWFNKKEKHMPSPEITWFCVFKKQWRLTWQKLQMGRYLGQGRIRQIGRDKVMKYLRSHDQKFGFDFKYKSHLRVLVSFVTCSYVSTRLFLLLYEALVFNKIYHGPKQPYMLFKILK